MIYIKNFTSLAAVIHYHHKNTIIFMPYKKNCHKKVHIFPNIYCHTKFSDPTIVCFSGDNIANIAAMLVLLKVGH
jgi:hypothetical protein